MNWDAIGAIGEVLGALGVITTLVYLAVQIRQNTRAVQGATVNAIKEGQQYELHWSSEIAAAFTKAIESPDQMDSIEVWRLSEWLTAAFNARQNELIQYERGLLDPEIWEGSKIIVGVIMSLPWAKKWWNQYGRDAYTPRFTAYVDSVIPDVSLVDYRELLMIGKDAQPLSR